MSAADADHEQAFISRVRRHMLVAPSGLLPFFAAGVLFYRLRGQGDQGPSPLLLLLGFAASMAVPATGLWSAHRYLRCPSCEAPVWQRDWHVSLLSKAGLGRGACKSCGAHIFGERLKREAARVTVAAMVGVALLSGLAALVASALGAGPGR